MFTNNKKSKIYFLTYISVLLSNVKTSLKNLLEQETEMNAEPELPNQIDIVSVLSEIIRKFERYNSAVETKST